MLFFLLVLQTHSKTNGGKEHIFVFLQVDTMYVYLSMFVYTCKSIIYCIIFVSADFNFSHLFQLEKSRVDPNDPRNLYLFELLESLPDSGMEDFFRIVDIEDIQRFIGKDGIDSNKRFTLLMMRDEGVLCVSVKSYLK